MAAEERSQDLEVTLREERQRIQTLERRYIKLSKYYYVDWGKF